jgi:hypothetical protein
MKKLEDALFFMVCISIIVWCAGCVSGNKAEVNAIKFEKTSTAKEVDQYVTTAGRVVRFFKGSEK